jgi:alkaline phosphatase D
MPTRLHAPTLLFILLLLLISALLFAQSDKPYVVMLSMDGFRWDYPEKCNTPNLDRVAAHGVRAVSMQPLFPSKTFPNHYTMVTGLYPDHHGIVQNEFYDPATGKSYRIGNRKAVEDPYFYEGEPVWVTAEKNNITSASFFWVGSEAPVEGIQPTYWKRYDQDFPFTGRIDTVIHWLSLPEAQRPQLITWYMDEPDNIGHDEGPSSIKTFEMVEYLDSLLGIFLDEIAALPIAGEINVIITSDHGMGYVNSAQTIYLKNYIENEWFEDIQGYNPNFLFYVKDEYAEKAWYVLKDIPHTSSWKHGEVPEYLHYGTHPRTGDFILVADSAWQVTMKDDSPGPGGAHGYDPRNTDMHAIFYAYGPAFKEGYVHPSFENIHLYSLICHILGVVPAENDGNLEPVKGMLRK